MLILSPRRLATPLVLCGLAAIASPATPGLPSQATQSQRPTIVTVDFRALTKDGNPVLDLKPEDVVLKVGGRVREIAALQLMQVGGGPGAQSTPAAPEPAMPFVTNEPVGGGREVMIVVDEDAIAPGREAPVRTALGHLLGALLPADRIGWLVPRNPAARMYLTNRHESIRTAVAGLTGRAPSRETAADAACRTRTNLDTLLDVFENVVPSVPTVVVFVSNGLTPPTAMESLNRSSGPTGACDVTTRDLDALAKAAGASRVHFFAVQVVDDMTSGAAKSTDTSGGLEHVAGLTGNSIVRLIGDSAQVMMKRIASETSAYYLAATEVPAEERNGSTQRVEVNVARQGVIVRARPTIVIPRPAVAGVKTEAVKVRDLLTVPKVFRDLPLRASAHTSRASADGKLKIVCVFEPSDPSQKLAAAAIALFDDKGTARAQWTGQPNDFRRTPVMVALNAPAPGTYRMRVAAADAAGTDGTVDQDIKIELAKGSGISVSELVLGVQDNTGFMPRLQFVSEQVAIALVEIYGVPKTATVAAAFELAAAESGPAAGVVAGTVQAPREDLRMAFAELPVGRMTPGDVVVRAVITVDGQPVVVRPVRTLRKVAAR